MSLRHGFKAEANRLAVQMRRELGLHPAAPLAPAQLAEHLAIPIKTFSSAIAHDARIERLLTTERESLSALTVHAGPRREIWVNDSHDPGRQNSSADHEIAHALLMHPPGPALDLLGCRHWDGVIEGEADWLAGNLLITNEAAWSIARKGTSPETAMLAYGVSRSMLTWRMNMSGANARRGRSAS
ncbi:ImmA/IrrE family metallo-endopeptidase [Streptomyces griseoruber]|uniref:ImmA/IrrE family metallo-endopeptidase n=1 Tax=Streptomyces griseoruber TaxID=1943 RepID=UPI00099E2B13|nr:ImmA/IrrE family metallo-endopeptidase [Streptomyces griseoruber]